MQFLCPNPRSQSNNNFWNSFHIFSSPKIFPSRNFFSEKEKCPGACTVCVHLFGKRDIEYITHFIAEGLTLCDDSDINFFATFVSSSFVFVFEFSSTPKKTFPHPHTYVGSHTSINQQQGKLKAKKVFPEIREQLSIFFLVDTELLFFVWRKPNANKSVEKVKG